MLILSLNFWRRADSARFVSRSGALIFHSTEKTSQSSAMSSVTQYIHILLITITFLSRMAEVSEAFSHSFLWGHFHLWFCYCSSISAAREIVHLYKSDALVLNESVQRNHSVRQTNWTDSMFHFSLVHSVALTEWSLCCSLFSNQSGD